MFFYHATLIVMNVFHNSLQEVVGANDQGEPAVKHDIFLTSLPHGPISPSHEKEESIPFESNP